MAQIYITQPLCSLWSLIPLRAPADFPRRLKRVRMSRGFRDGGRVALSDISFSSFIRYIYRLGLGLKYRLHIYIFIILDILCACVVITPEGITHISIDVHIWVGWANYSTTSQHVSFIVRRVQYREQLPNTERNAHLWRERLWNV